MIVIYVTTYSELEASTASFLQTTRHFHNQLICNTQSHVTTSQGVLSPTFDTVDALISYPSRKLPPKLGQNRARLEGNRLMITAVYNELSSLCTVTVLYIGERLVEKLSV